MYIYKVVSVSTYYKSDKEINDSLQLSINRFTKEGWKLHSLNRLHGGPDILIFEKEEVQSLQSNFKDIKDE